MISDHSVLYIAETARGGSAFSLLMLIQGIQNSRYKPVVLFIREDHPYIGEKLRKMGIEVLVLKNHKLFDAKEDIKKIPKNNNKKIVIGKTIQKYFGMKIFEGYLALKSCYEFLRYRAVSILPLIKILKKNRIDLIHLNSGLRNGEGAILAGCLAGVPVVCHGRWFSKWTAFEKIFIRFVKFFIFISKAVSEHFAKLGVTATKGMVIHNAIDLSNYNNGYDIADVRREFGWGTEEKIICMVGRIVKWKGHEYFLKTIAEFCKKNPLVRGIIIGEPPISQSGQRYFQKLKFLTQELGIAQKVVFTGFRDDVPRLMSAMDIVVHFSTKPEPFGRVVIEGMASEKPVIATAAGGVMDIIEDGVTGILVPCGDSRALAHAIEQILSNPFKARQIGIAARKSVEAKFTIQKHASEVKEIYDLILN